MFDGGKGRKGKEARAMLVRRRNCNWRGVSGLKFRVPVCAAFVCVCRSEREIRPGRS